MHPTAQKIQAQFPEHLIDAREAFGELTLQLRRSGIAEVCRFLRDDPDLAFDHITDICSVDYPEDEERFEVVYHFYSIRKRHRIRVKARLPEEDCTIDSLTGLWRGANFLEREVYDMMGIRFNHHPDLRRILLTDDFDGYPLRKDFPTEGRGWRNTFEFIPKIE
ncbi:MAG TPA: NADH-quinone oxidoreductase subunit C [Nitrospiria bacterium]|nr:NADH-quinone oxidoreductase subunit C [Nitrospiria bacterium]